jgi:sugar lactone lactonase YvrE
MTTLSTRSGLAFTAALLLAASGCHGGDEHPATGMDGGADGGAPLADAASGATTDAGTCATGGEGTLSVTVTGLPSGTAPSGHVSAAGGSEHAVTAAGTLTLPAGPYQVTADRVIVPDPIVRAVFDGTPSPRSVCVKDGATASVTLAYALVPTSNKLWVGNSNSASGPLLGFTPSQLGRTGAPRAAIGAYTTGAGGFTFDRDGNVWVVGGTVSDPPLARFPAARFSAGGQKTPDVTIDSAVLTTGVPGPRALAFDQAGNLWVTVVAAEAIVRFTPADLASSGQPVPAVQRTALKGLEGLAFDATGDLWFAFADGVGHVAKDALGASGAGADYVIHPETPPPVVGPLPGPVGLAFDATGNLWGAFGGTLARLAPADLSRTPGTKEKTVTPAVQITGSVLGLPVGIAFDESGALWVAGTAGTFLRYEASSLVASGSPTPSVVVSSTSTGYAEWFALFPAPAALPLYHALPQ